MNVHRSNAVIAAVIFLFSSVLALPVQAALDVGIDIRPGTSRNPINLKSHGVIPVVLLTTRTADGDAQDFDVADVDPATLSFGPAGAAPAHRKYKRNSKSRSGKGKKVGYSRVSLVVGHRADVDGDGDVDLLLHFRIQDTGIACRNLTASLSGVTTAGVPFSGSDSIVTQGCKRIPNIEPLADSQSLSSNEDTPALITLSGSDANTDTLSFTIISGPAHGSLGALTPLPPSQASLSYTPDPDYNGPDSFEFAVDDGFGGSATATVAIAVAPVNDAPSFSVGPDQDLLSDGAPVSIPAWATAISSGPANEAGQALNFIITANDNPALFAVAPAVAPDGSLSFTSLTNASGTARLSVLLMDDGGTGNGGVDQSPPQTFSIRFTSPNAIPVADPTSASVPEDSPGQLIFLTGSDADGDDLTFSIVTPPAHGSLGLVAQTGLDTAQVSYLPDADYFGPDSFVIRANDGLADSPAAVVSITVLSVNDPPVFSGGGDVTVDEDSGAFSQLWATAISVGPANEGQTPAFTLTSSNPALFSVAPSMTGGGVLSFTPAADQFGSASVQVELSDGVDSVIEVFTLNVNPINDPPQITAPGSLSINEDGSSGPLALTVTDVDDAAVSVSAVSSDTSLIPNGNLALADMGGGNWTVTATPVADGFGGPVTITLSADDGATSVDAPFTITVLAVNDAPAFSAGGNEASESDGAPVTVVGWASGMSAGPANESGQTLSFVIDSNDNPGLFSAGPAVDPVSGDLSYTGVLNASGVATIGLRLMDDGGTANGGVDTSVAQTFSITLTPPNDPPVANDDSYATVGNTLLEVGVTPSGAIAVQLSGSVLDNDTDADGPSALVVSAFTTPALGSVNMNPDGSFTYTPPVGMSPLIDSFTYEVSDGAKTDTGTVQINISERVWYVDNRNSGGTGTSADPFGLLADAGPALLPGDTLYVASGDGSPVGLDSGLVIAVPDVSLLGEGVALDIGGTTLAPAGTRPVIGNVAGPGLSLLGAHNTLVTGLDIADTLGDGLVVDNSTGVLLDTMSILRSGESAIEGGGAEVSLVLTDVVIDTVDVTDPSSSDDAIFLAATASSGLVMTGGSISGVPGSLGDGIEFENATASPVAMSLDVRGVNFSAIGQDGIKLDNDNGVMDVQIGGPSPADGNSLDVGFRGVQIQTDADPSLARTNTILIRHNTITSADEGIQLRLLRDTSNISVLDNVLNRAAGGSAKDLIDIQSEFTSVVQARVNDNDINNAGGSDGIKVRVFDGATVTMEALRNDITGPDEGFDFDVIDALAMPTTLNATVKDNVLSSIITRAMLADNKDATSVTCLDLVGNSAVADYAIDNVSGGSFALTMSSQATVFDPAGGVIDSTPVSCTVPSF